MSLGAWMDRVDSRERALFPLRCAIMHLAVELYATWSLATQSSMMTWWIFGHHVMTCCDNTPLWKGSELQGVPIRGNTGGGDREERGGTREACWGHDGADLTPVIFVGSYLHFPMQHTPWLSLNLFLQNEWLRARKTHRWLGSISKK